MSEFYDIAIKSLLGLLSVVLGFLIKNLFKSIEKVELKIDETQQMISDKVKEEEEERKRENLQLAQTLKEEHIKLADLINKIIDKINNQEQIHLEKCSNHKIEVERRLAKTVTRDELIEMLTKIDLKIDKIHVRYDETIKMFGEQLKRG